MNIDSFFARDKDSHYISVYPTVPFFLDIQYDGKAITGWTLYSINDCFDKTSGEDDLELLYTLSQIIDKYELKTYSDNKQDYIIVYTDNILRLKALIGDNFKTSRTTANRILDGRVMTYFDIREYGHSNEFSSKESILEWYPHFVAEKRAYLSPSQAQRKRLKKAVGKDETAKKIYPSSVSDYNYERAAIHGGITYAQDNSGKIYERPMLALDLTSAYIYALVVDKHCMSDRKQVQPIEWENYVNNTCYGSIGTYDIEYSFMFQYIRCFKDVEGKHLQNGHRKVRVVFDNVDLTTFINLPHIVIHNIECKKLREFKLDIVPEYYRKFSIENYIKKEELPRGSVARDNQKECLNSGTYGECLVDIFKYIKQEPDETNADYYTRLDRHLYKTIKSKTAKVATIPLWGVYALSYTKKHVFELATQLVGWRYSDTDSIYCDDTPENRVKIREYNTKIRELNKVFCDTYGYTEDYEKLKDLGTFKLEAKIIKFRSFGTKSYAYRTVDDVDVLHFAGCTYDKAPADLWKDDFKPGTSRTETGIDKYGNYYERTVGNASLMIDAFCTHDKI